MAHIVADRVKETSSTTGTGTFTLTGAVSAFRTFASQLATSDTTWYCAVNGTEWEVGLGTLASSTTLARTTLLASSTGSAVSFTAGPTIFCTLPSMWATGRRLAQVPYFTTGALASGSTAMVADDSIPQQTEGDQYMSLAITPTNANSLLEIDVVLMVSPSASQEYAMAALYRDSTANALAATVGPSGNYSWGPVPLTIKWFVSAASTSASTFKVRAGATSGSMNFNGRAGVRLFAGVMGSSISIKEWLP